MPQAGHYEEPLGDGGTLRVRKESWDIHYYFSGPDLRYTGTSVTIDGPRVRLLIEAYLAAFKRYEELKRTVPSSGSFVEQAGMELTIRVGDRYHEGVCMASYHSPVSNARQLSGKLNGYQDAIARASVIRGMLAAL